MRVQGMRGKGERVAVGRHGEEEAERHLTRRGFRLIERRFRVRNGEIDLVMADGKTIVFVEVRRRRSALAGDPLDSIDQRKRRRIIRTARLYLHVRGLYDRPCRFDVVAIRDDARPGEGSIEHIADAFRVE
jgi:putative endonuclease